MKKIQQHIRAIYTALILKVSGKFKRLEQVFLNRFGGNKQIIYNFDMKEFYTIEGKIRENRQRLREIFDNYKKIETYYPLYFAYVTLIGFYSYNVIEYFLSIENVHFTFMYGVAILSHISLFVYSFYLFFKLIYLKPLYNDLLPNDVYCDLYSQYLQNEQRDSEENSKLSEEEFKNKIETKTNTRYLKDLEEGVLENFDKYAEKKLVLTKLIKIISLSIAIYITLITTYKLETMINNKKQKEQTKTEFKKQETDRQDEIKPKIRKTNESDTSKNNKKQLNN
jgi:hypothetical protein